MTNNRIDLLALITHTDDCDHDSYRDPDAHDLAQEMLRDMLILDDDDRIDETTFELDYYRDNYDRDDIDSIYESLRSVLTELRTDRYSIHFLSQLRLDNSLCPIHHCDYMACFEDDDPECATIRAYFPDHDT
jgi:hypothetical protein